MVNDKYKVVRVSLPTYGYLMDHRTSNLKTVDSVIWSLIKNHTKLEAKIEALEYEIAELKMNDNLEDQEEEH